VDARGTSCNESFLGASSSRQLIEVVLIEVRVEGEAVHDPGRERFSLDSQVEGDAQVLRAFLSDRCFQRSDILRGSDEAVVDDRLEMHHSPTAGSDGELFEAGEYVGEELGPGETPGAPFLAHGVYYEGFLTFPDPFDHFRHHPPQDILGLPVEGLRPRVPLEVFHRHLPDGLSPGCAW